MSDGPIAASAARVLETFMADIIPPGKSGALVTVFDAQGVRLGCAVKDGDDFAASFEVRQAFTQARPDVRGTVRFTW